MPSITLDYTTFKANESYILARASEIHVYAGIVTVWAPSGNLQEIEEACSWAP